jgi:protein-arginine kinase activator protein McsA
VSRSARHCRTCHERTVLVERTKIARVGRVRRLSCYTCGEVERTVEVTAATMAEVLAGDADLIADLWRAVSPAQTEMGGE